MLKDRQRILIVNHTLNENHELLSHQVGITKALAKVFEHIYILTTENQVSVDFSLDYSSIRNQHQPSIKDFFRYYFLFINILFTFRPNVVFFHMAPKQCAMVGPLLRVLGIQNILWYAHKSSPLSLKICNLFCNKILTCSPGSLQIRTHKKEVTGHHIDEKIFYGSPKAEPVRLAITVGRVDNNKNFQVILESFANAAEEGLLDRLIVVGNSSSLKDKQQFEKQLEATHLTDRQVICLGRVARVDLPGILSKADVFLHASTGSLDKAPIEALLIGLPIATINEEFIDIFDSWTHKKHPSLIQEIRAMLELPTEARLRAIEEKMAIAQKSHSLTSWATKFPEFIK
jgi:glycosyltransferase involved in cell wall biosynthesis